MEAYALEATKNYAHLDHSASQLSTGNIISIANRMIMLLAVNTCLFLAMGVVSLDSLIRL